MPPHYVMLKRGIQTYFCILQLYFEKIVHSVDTGPVIEDAGVEVEAEVEVGQEVEITPVFHLI